MFKRKLLINSEIIKKTLKGKPLIVIDAGARGNLFEPFDKIDNDMIKVIMFEPDNSAKVELKENRIFFNKGVWDKKTQKILYLSRKGSISSIYPPDEKKLNGFLGVGSYECRKPIKKIIVELESLDNLIESNSFEYPDFIKLDIHSSEFEALIGSRKSLLKNLGVMVEAWTFPVHKCQKLYSNVEVLLNSFNFFLFDYLSLHKWKRKGFTGFSNRQIIFLEGLYFKEMIEIKETIPAIKFLCLLDLYGYYEYFYHSILYFKTKKIISKKEFEIILKIVKENNSFIRNLKFKFLDYLQRLSFYFKGLY